MTELTDLFQRIVESANKEDLLVLDSWLKNFEKKQQGEYSTYLTAGLGMTRSLSASSCTAVIPVSPLISNSVGIPHGGILATLLDTAMGSLANSRCPEGFGAVTTTLNVHYLAVADEEQLTAEAAMIRQGTHTMVIEGYIIQQDGRRIAQATGTFFIVPKRG